jgi:alpha-galactosidase
MRGKPKVAVIGAGSLSHGKRLIDDILSVRELEGGGLALMGMNPRRLDIVGRYAKRAAASLMPSGEVLVTTDRSRALEGADLVFALFDAGGFPAFDLDYRIALKYGLDICIGDTVGPLAAMRALRNGPLMLSLADDMRRLCPEALLVNFVNPMAPMVAAAASRGVDCVGLCGGIEATRGYVAEILGMEKARLRTVFAGVNHLCWLLEMSGPEGDLYPRFRELMKDPDRRGEEASRFEILQQFGYFVTESSGHVSDFFPWFRRNEELRERYCYGRGYSGARGAYRKLSAFAQRHLGEGDFLEGELPSTARSSGHGPAILEAVLGGGSARIYGNVMNGTAGERPAIPKLPASACVELPLLIEGRRLVVPPAPELPTALAALCSPSVFQHGLVLEAILNEDPELVFAAIAQDPCTAAMLDLPSMRSLAAELLAANAAWFPAGLSRNLPATVDAGLRPSRCRGEKGDPLLDLVRNYERRLRGKTGGSGPNPGS